MDVNTGDTLRKLRKEHGYTREQVATIIGVEEAEVAQWEHTASYPDADKLVALAVLYRSRVDEIVKREGE